MSRSFFAVVASLIVAAAVAHGLAALRDWATRQREPVAMPVAAEMR